MRRCYSLIGSICLSLAGTQVMAGDILNLDNVPHKMRYGQHQNAMQEMVINPNQRVQLPASDVIVQLLDGAHPQAEYHVEQRDVWVIWPKGAFGLQVHRKVSAGQR